MSESAFQTLVHHCPRADLLHLITGALRKRVVLPLFARHGLTKPARTARRVRPPPRIEIGGDKRYDVARLSTGAPGSQPTLWNWPPRNICQTRLLALTSSAAFRRPPRRGSVLLSTCGCACVRRGRRKKKEKGIAVTGGMEPPRASVVQMCVRKVDLNWPPPQLPGKKDARLLLHSLPATTPGFVFSVVDFFVTAHSSLAQGFLKCLSAVLGIHTGILERWRFVCRVLLPGSAKLCREAFNTVTNRARFSRELCLFVIKGFCFVFLLLDWNPPPPPSCACWIDEARVQ